MMLRFSLLILCLSLLCVQTASANPSMDCKNAIGSHCGDVIDNSTRNAGGSAAAVAVGGTSKSTSVSEGGDARATGGNATQGQIGINALDSTIRNNTQDTNVNLVDGARVNDVLDIERGAFDVDSKSNVSNSGNSENDLTSIQSQTGINANETNVDTTDFNVVKGSSQGQTNGDFSGDVFDARDQSTTTFEAADIPVESAAPVAASACSMGVSGQGMTFGGSVGTVNPYCNLALLAETARANGDPDTAKEAIALMLRLAQDDTAGWRKHFRQVPVLGGFFRFVF